jgi:CRISPR/Cas system-associated endonuclease/helicase Cas3
MHNILKQIPHLQKTAAELAQLQSPLQKIREAFHLECSTLRLPHKRIVHFCTVPTGLGKGLALLVYAMRLCEKYNADRIVVITPFLTLCRQHESNYKEWLTTDIGNASSSGRYTSKKDRSETKKWQKEITVTSYVDLLRTFSSLNPYKSRMDLSEKAEKLANTILILDDADQWIQPHMAPHVLGCLQHLLAHNCHPILISATLPRYWEIDGMTPLPMPVEEIALPANVKIPSRVKMTLHDNFVVRDIINIINAHPNEPGVIVVNTVHTAILLQVFLQKFYGKKKDIGLLTGKLASYHRREKERIYAEKLSRRDGNFILVATSCIQAGWDVSFAYGLREATSLADILQTRGRINRSGEYGLYAPLHVFTFGDEPLAKPHPGLRKAIACLDLLWTNAKYPPGPERCTDAMRALLTQSPSVFDRQKRIKNFAKLNAHKDTLKTLLPDLFSNTTAFPPLDCIKNRVIREKVSLGQLDEDTMEYLLSINPGQAKLLERIGFKRMLNRAGKPYYVLNNVVYSRDTGLYIKTDQEE